MVRFSDLPVGLSNNAGLGVCDLDLGFHSVLTTGVDSRALSAFLAMPLEELYSFMAVPKADWRSSSGWLMVIQIRFVVYADAGIEAFEALSETGEDAD